jgi:hypothetical protein
MTQTSRAGRLLARPVVRAVDPEINRRRVLAATAEQLCHSVRTLPPGLSRAKGTECEELLRRFLAAFLPKRFAVGTGYVVGAGEALSYETDVLIHDALNGAVYPLTGSVAMVPCDSVAAAIEVKAKLYGGYLREEFLKARVLKSLGANTPPFIALLAFGNKNPLHRVGSEYTRLIREFGADAGFDAVAVLDQGLVTAAPSAEGTSAPVRVEALGMDTLAAFLRLLLAHLARFPARFGDPGLAEDAGRREDRSE